MYFDLMIILFILLVILTLISILAGSIRYNTDVNKQIVIHPEPKEKFEENKITSNVDKNSKLHNVLTGKPYKYIAVDQEHVQQEARHRNTSTQKQIATEGFQGAEYAAFA